MSEQPLVSVGIPTYNRPAGLKRTLECITGQTYQNLEIIISDNASTDPEVESVGRDFESRDPRIRYFRQKENNGAGANFKFVLQQATGDYYMWASDDDEWEDTFVASLVSHLERLPNIGLAMCQVTYQIIETGEQFRLLQGLELSNHNISTMQRYVNALFWENYGELFYGIFRRNLINETKFVGVNDVVTILLKVMLTKNVFVSDKFLYKKNVSLSVFRWSYLCAKDKSPLIKDLSVEARLRKFKDEHGRSVKNFWVRSRYTFVYHCRVLPGCIETIAASPLGLLDKLFLMIAQTFVLIRTAFWAALKHVSIWLS